MIMELLLVLNVMDNVLVVKMHQITVLNVLPEETLHQLVFVMMELMMKVVFVCHVHIHVPLVILNTIVLHAQMEEN